MSEKAPDAFRTISEAAEELDLPQHVLRFWETRFPQIRPMKRGGGRRYYRPDDVAFLRGLKHLLHDQRYTIKGVQKIIKEQGLKAITHTAAEGRAVSLNVLPGDALLVASPSAVAPVASTSPQAEPALRAVLAELLDYQRATAHWKERLAALPSATGSPIPRQSRSVAQPG